MKKNNYETLVAEAAQLFLKCDPDEMARIHGLERDGDHLYVPFLDLRAVVSLKDGSILMTDPAGKTRAASIDEAMTLYDFLGYSKTKPVVSGSWASVSELGGIIGSYHAQHLKLPEVMAKFSGRAELLKRAAFSVGGKDGGTSGDVSVILPVLPDFPMWFQFWDGDEEFPPHDQFLFDRNALTVLHYETLWYASPAVRSRLISRMDEEAHTVSEHA